MRVADSPSAGAMALSRSGRVVAVRHGANLTVVDCVGVAPRVVYPLAASACFAFVGDSLWLARDRELEVVPAQARQPTVRALLPRECRALVPTLGRHATSAVVHADDEPLLAVRGEERIDLDRLPGWTTALPLAGRRVLVARPGETAVVDAGRTSARLCGLPPDATPVLASSVLGGRAIALLVTGPSQSAFLVLGTGGSLVHRIQLPPLRAVSIADDRGVAVALSADGDCLAADLRYGRVTESSSACVIDDIEIDSEGRYAAVRSRDRRFAAAESDEALPGDVHHVPYVELFRAPLHGPRVRVVDPALEVPSGAAAVPEPARQDVLAVIDGAPAAPPTGRAAEPAPRAELRVPPRLGALAPLPPARGLDAAAAEHVLDSYLDFVGALAFRGIAEAWNDGRLSFESTNTLPFESEAQGLVGLPRPGAAKHVMTAAQLVQQALTRLRAATSDGNGRASTIYALAHEFGLDPVATRVLVAVAAPSLRPRLARLYGILSNDPARPLVDESLLQDLLRHDDVPARLVSCALEPSSPLVRYGLIRIHGRPGRPPGFYEIAINSAAVARLKGRGAPADADGVARSYTPTRTLSDLLAPGDALQAFLDALVEPGAAAARIVVRGRRGSGRRSILAAVAALGGRGLTVIDVARLGHDPHAAIERLELEAEQAFIAGHLPCVSGIDDTAFEEPSAQHALRATLARLPMPLALRLGSTARPPLDEAYLGLDLGALDGTQRGQLWSDVATRLGLSERDALDLASRFRVTPGIVHAAAARTEAEGATDAAHLSTALQQSLSASFGTVADRIERLATWEQLVLPSEVLNSVRELVSRARNTHRVYDGWGFDRVMSSSRGLVALFQGGPGTGKTMVAGAIARELGLELYRVDVSRVMSKWLGETEKNLGAVFDAAEDGQALLLFDEADSLFAKRTEVRTSNDRYANLEVNYLLQRLDAFQGIAILTTNFGRSIDAAFNRRLSLHLTFPFPDEEMRERLWRAHLPAELPTADDLELRALAKKYQLSGGFIRNAALRAAFLAAGEGTMLGQRHLLHAVRMEYQDLGRLSEGATLE